MEILIYIVIGLFLASYLIGALLKVKNNSNDIDKLKKSIEGLRASGDDFTADTIESYLNRILITSSNRKQTRLIQEAQNAVMAAKNRKID